MSEAKQILQESGLPITPAHDLEDAAVKAVSSLFHDEQENAPHQH